MVFAADNAGARAALARLDKATKGEERSKTTPIRDLMDKYGIANPSAEEGQRRVDEYARKPMAEDHR